MEFSVNSACRAIQRIGEINLPIFFLEFENLVIFINGENSWKVEVLHEFVDFWIWQILIVFFYSKSQEDILHFFLNCGYAKAIWFASI